MTNHLNVNWGATAEINRREFNTQVKWDETYNPADPLVGAVYSKLGSRRPVRSTEADHTIAPEKALRKVLHRMEVLNPSADGSNKNGSEDRDEERRRHHVHRKHRSDCPKHMLNQLKREGAPTGQQVVSPTKPPAIPEEQRQTVALPTVAGSSPSRFRSVVAATQRASPKGVSAMGTFGCGGRASQEVGAYVPKPDPHPLTNVEKERIRKEREDAYLRGSSATNQATSRVDALLAKQPFHVGRSFAACVTGSYNPHVNQLKPKLLEQHPDFGQLNAEVDGLYERYKDQLSWRSSTRPEEGGDARRIGHVKTVPDKLVMDEHDTTHYRRRYDMKTYLEGMRQLGANNLLRK